MSRVTRFGAGAAALLALLVLGWSFAGSAWPSRDDDAGAAAQGSTARGASAASVSTESMSMSGVRRVLVLVTDASAGDDVARLRGRYRVLSQLGDRILVLEVDETAASELARDPALSGPFEDEVPADARATLRQDERLFVDGWLQQRAQQDKKRPGDGASWDTPGFQPPDTPPRKP
jgi:hypothetical protein